MTRQIHDRFLWNGESYCVVTFRGDSFYKPADFGLNVKGIMTACYKGYNACYYTKDKLLYVDTWIIYATEDCRYPEINGVKPETGWGDDWKFLSKEPKIKKVMDRGATYKNLGIRMKITADIIIGKGLLGGRQGLHFLAPGDYETTYELSFAEGVLVDAKDTSGTYDDWDYLKKNSDWNLV